MKVAEADRRTEHRLAASDLEDPLEDYSGPSLFPRTFPSLSGAPPPPNSDDPYLTHNFLNSMMCKNVCIQSLHLPEELLESVKSIRDGSSELQNCGIPTTGVSKEKSDDVSEEFLGPPCDRRPALDRKRARFLLKPDSSPTKIGFETTLDIHKLKDPEEFFSAFERFENANLEMQKHMKRTANPLMDLNENYMSMAQRSRRPGISRKSAKYKHSYSTAISSQENLEERIIHPSPSKTSHGVDVPNAHLEEMGVVGESLKTSHGIDVPNTHSEETDVIENTVNELLDDLLNNSDEELDGDKAFTLLQKHMQIKPISVGKLVLPDLQDIRRLDNKASEGRLASPRIMFSGIQTLLKGTSSKITQQVRTPVQHSASPTPEKSPFTSISLLGKQISQSTRIPDLFSSDIMYQSPRDSGLLGSSCENLDKVCKEKEQSMSDAARSLIADGTKTTSAPSEKSEGENTIGAGIDTDAGSVQNLYSLICTETQPAYISPRSEQSEHDALKSGTLDGNETKSASSEKYKSDYAGVPGINADVSSSVSQPEMQDRFCGTVSENSCRFDDQIMLDAGSDIHTAEPVEINDRVETMQQEVDFSAEVLLPIDNLSRDQTKSKHSLHVDEENAKDKSTETAMDQETYTAEEDDRSSKVQVEKQKRVASRLSRIKRNELATSCSQRGDVSSEVQVKKQRKAVSRPTKSKKKCLAHRQSLAVYGTEMQSGLRRSTRIRSRPLEYWRGEKFLYGRVHSSLPTVIGIRYGSPGSGGETPCLKVKSFVSNEYMDLVERAALF